jgi:hypothetical protein
MMLKRRRRITTKFLLMRSAMTWMSCWRKQLTMQILNLMWSLNWTAAMLLWLLLRRK